ncbi:MAG: tetratricopeptide repeat protein [Verrucomicrobiia bacterium]|jgi:tetratricopeptide (TPR) repeat protein
MKREARIVVGAALAVAAITVWVHWPSIHGGFLNWDDDLYLEEVARHPRLTWQTVAWAFSATVPFYYHPLTFLSHVADYQLWGKNPAGHHLTNLLLHGLNSGLVVLFLWMLLENVGASFGERVALAGGVALVFGLHPLQVEPVAWVAERKTILCAFFSLTSLCAYLQLTRRPSSRPWRWAMTLLFVAALLAKPMAMTLPLVMLVMDFFPLRRHEIIGWRRLLKEKSLLFGLSALDLALTVIGQARSGAVMAMQAHSVGERCLAAARGVVFYLWKLTWPGWLCPFYPLGGTMSLRQAEFLVPVILVAVISVLVVRLRRRAPALLAAWCCYLALLVPVSGLMQVGSQAVADRFMYLAMLAPLLVLGWGGVWLWRRVRAAGWSVLLLLLCGELIFLVVRTRQQIPVWRNSETLWTNVLGHFPRSGIAHGHLAMALAEQRRFEEALPYAQAALADIPDYPVARATLEDVCSELAIARVERRQFAEALPYTREALELNPTNSSVRAMLGLIYLKTRQFTEAAPELQEALRLNPDLPAARYNLACAYSRLGRFAEAFAALENLLPSQPQFAQAATRDTELAALRADPIYGERLRTLTGGARVP